MSRLRTAVVAAALLCSAVLLHSGLRYGFSARDEPTAVETWIARTMRVMAIPAFDRARENPVRRTEAVLLQASRHFADHCASCHSNDGSGNTPLGRRLYPKAPDMRSGPTQELSDGELFYIIRNGIRLSGMPAWSDEPPEHDAESWGLVHFLRQLPRLSAAEVTEMKRWNPKGRAELDRERQIEDFLSGGDAPASGSLGH